MNTYLKSTSKIPHNLRCHLLALKAANDKRKAVSVTFESEFHFAIDAPEGFVDDVVWHGLKLLELLDAHEKTHRHAADGSSE